MATDSASYELAHDTLRVASNHSLPKEAPRVFATTTESKKELLHPPDMVPKRNDLDQKTVDRTVLTMHVRHIYFAVKSDADFHKVCIKAEGVLLALTRPKQPADQFLKLAQSLSDCPSAANGGDLGWITPETCPAELYNELFCQSDWLSGQGVHPRLVRTQHGLHIVEVLARKKKRLLALNTITAPLQQTLIDPKYVPSCFAKLDSKIREGQLKSVESADAELAPDTMIDQNAPSSNDGLLDRLRHFQSDYFPAHQQRFQDLVAKGQHPKTLFIGCSDSRVVPYLLTGAGPGELFIVRNVGALVPPYDGSHGLHGTMAAIEFAVLSLKVERIIVCGHSHCGAIRTAYQGAPKEARALQNWLELTKEALLPVQPCAEAFHRTEQRSVVLQMERLMDYPMVRREVEARKLTLHGWHYVIETGQVHVFDVSRGDFIPCTEATSSGTGPYTPYSDPPQQ